MKSVKLSLLDQQIAAYRLSNFENISWNEDFM